MNKAHAMLGLAIALGTQSRIREDIEKEYLSKETVYHKELDYLKNTKISLFDKFTLGTAESIKQSFCIVSYNTIRDNEIVINRLLKRGYRDIFNYYNHNRLTLLSMELFTSKYAQKAGGMEEVSGMYLDYCYYVLLYLMEFRGGRLHDTGFAERITDQLEATIYDELSIRLKMLSNLNGMSNSVKLKVEQSTEELYEKYSSKRVGLGKTVAILLENIRLKDEKILINTGRPMVNIEKEIDKMPNNKIINAMHLILGICGIESSFTNEAEVDEDLFRGIMKTLQLSVLTHGTTKREVEVMFICSLFLYTLSTEYNKVRNVHYEGLKTKVADELNSLKEEYDFKFSGMELEIEERTNETLELKRELQDKVSANKVKEEEIRKMQAELKRLKKENSKLKESEKELEELKSYLDTEFIDVEELEKVTLETAIEGLKSIKGVFVGGNTNLQNEIKQVLPDFTFVQASEVSKDLSHLKGKDVIFNSKMSNKHGMYYKLNSLVRGSGTKLVRLDTTTNKELLLKEMYSKSKG